MNTIDPGVWRDATEHSRRQAPQLGWLASLRDTALERLIDRGLPRYGEEDWRYTKLDDFTQRGLAYLGAASSATTSQPTASDHRASAESHRIPGRAGTALAASLILLDGEHLPDAAMGSAMAPALPSGVSVTSLRSASPEARQRASHLLDDQVHLRDGQPFQDTAPLVALNTALLIDGVLIATEPGVQTTGTVIIRIEASGRPVMAQPRVLVDVAPGSRLSLIIEHTGPSQGAPLTNLVTRIEVGAGAQLDLLRLQRLPDDGFLTETSEVSLATGAVAKFTSVDLGAAFSRHELSIALNGANAVTDIQGIFVADGQRHLDNRTRVEHRAPGTRSREFYRGIADSHGRGVFNGRIVVQRGAAGSDAALTNRNLLLAPTAEIDTKPELEIYADDVRCSHGATTGQLDAAALFYLRSRGLDLPEARRVLIDAFLRQGLAGIALPALRTALEAQLTARLSSMHVEAVT